ncbi:MAG: DUF296 domain-containing protein [Candidatus Omnitrophica bacterium]|nr:DUF296 domain-containing protein [Candidatus Omnitrophota bacterium]MDD5042422.1 DUF296 domain-containing protein [Candidatus Omnitrophota bacterium]MDD5500815.1 DUF296 domain-containing protein [Candidatus Omnitrophota bacterium]
MKYTKGSLGRVFLLKFEDKDIFIDELRAFALKERLKTACLVFIGALRDGKLATGPRKPVIPPQPNTASFKDGWEVLGLGTVFTNSSGPQIHIHTSMGKKKSVLTGCLRGKSRVFLVIEAVLLELKGVKAGKDIDPRTGLNLLHVF